MSNIVRERQQLIKEAVEETLKAERRALLPHIYGFKPYKWTNEYWASTNRMKFICAANQISKSSTQIRHAIDLATDKTKWPKFFPKRNPKVFWYIYPNKDKVSEEYDEKWVKEFLPRGAMAEDADYGWAPFYRRGSLAGIKFNSGVTLYFKTWLQDLQSGTVDALFIDEEIPENLYPELAMRVTRYDGMLSMVFTATLNQTFWHDVIEKRGKKDERFKSADKWQISMEHDCRFYADGSPSPWTPEEVQKQKNKCGTETEINRRIHGRFVSEKGLMYPSFSRSRNFKEPMKIPAGWDYYGGVDIGTGGPDAHPAAVSILAVRPDYKYGRLIRIWIGDEENTTDTTQILNKYIDLSADLNMTDANYDWASKEFHLRAMAAGIPFSKANKAKDFGEDLLNILFKNGMLDIEDYGLDAHKLLSELETLRSSTPKQHAIDNGCDSLRYAASKIPWDLSDITTKPIEINNETKKEKTPDEQRIEYATKQSNETKEAEDETEWGFEREMEEFNDLMEC